MWCKYNVIVAKAQQLFSFLLFEVVHTSDEDEQELQAAPETWYTTEEPGLVASAGRGLPEDKMSCLHFPLFSIMLTVH